MSWMNSRIPEWIRRGGGGGAPEESMYRCWMGGPGGRGASRNKCISC